jgi:hypothetical protein
LAIEFSAGGTTVTCPKCNQPTHVPKPLTPISQTLPKPSLPTHPVGHTAKPAAAPHPSKTGAIPPGATTAAPHAEIPIIAPSTPEHGPAKVIVTDVRMPFGSMVVFMIKWAFAAIPAFLILAGLGALVALALIKIGLTSVMSGGAPPP